MTMQHDYAGVVWGIVTLCAVPIGMLVFGSIVEFRDRRKERS